MCLFPMPMIMVQPSGVDQDFRQSLVFLFSVLIYTQKSRFLFCTGKDRCFFGNSCMFPCFSFGWCPKYPFSCRVLVLLLPVFRGWTDINVADYLALQIIQLTFAVEFEKRRYMNQVMNMQFSFCQSRWSFGCERVFSFCRCAGPFLLTWCGGSRFF